MEYRVSISFFESLVTVLAGVLIWLVFFLKVFRLLFFGSSILSSVHELSSLFVGGADDGQEPRNILIINAINTEVLEAQIRHLSQE